MDLNDTLENLTHFCNSNLAILKSAMFLTVFFPRSLSLCSAGDAYLQNNNSFATCVVESARYLVYRRERNVHQIERGQVGEW